MRVTAGRSPAARRRTSSTTSFSITWARLPGHLSRPPVVASDVAVQAYEWFGLRDGRTTATWSALGVLRDDYTRKPAFATLQHLIANQAART